MKKFISIICILLISFIFISCSNKNNTLDSDINNINKPLEENLDNEKELEEKIYTEFKALGNIYTSTKNINDLEPGDIITSADYIRGEYKEIDFAYDILNYYLNENPLVFDSLVSFDTSSEDKFIKITEEDKNKLISDLNSLRSQMYLSPSEEMIVKLDQVTYEGASYETNSGVTLKFRAAISRSSDYLAAWNYFTITVYEKEDTLYCNLF